MTEFTYIIKDSHGIHARPAGQLVKTANEFKSEISITKDKSCADAKKIFSVMSLGIKYNDQIKFTIVGTDETDAETKLKEFLTKNL